MLEGLTVGASLSTVAAVAGVPKQTFHEWLSKGRKARTGVYRQLYEDVYGAMAQARRLAEATVKDRDPFKWLRNSPSSREIGDEWRDDPEIMVSSDQNQSQAPMDQQDLMEALVELRRCGIDLNALADSGAKSLEVVDQDLIESKMADDDAYESREGEHRGEENPSIPQGFLDHIERS